MLLCASTARAEEPRVTCVATRSGRRVVVRPRAEALLAPELERLIRLGLAGRLEVTVTLLQRRSLWFDARRGETTLTQVVGFSREEGFLLDGRALPTGPQVLDLERVAWTLEALVEPGEDLVARVEVRLQVVTAASLGKVASWLTRGEEENAEGGALSQNVLRTVAEDLTRRARGQCNVAPVETRPVAGTTP
ncbi:hypothetical protein P2318_05820 [Myxococcaceae bacterium GXIMD 01537]